MQRADLRSINFKISKRSIAQFWVFDNNTKAYIAMGLDVMNKLMLHMKHETHTGCTNAIISR